MNELKAGDCVKLKHGGGDVKMTINNFAMHNGVNSAVCTWWNEKENKFETKAFSLDAIQLCENTQSGN